MTPDTPSDPATRAGGKPYYAWWVLGVLTLIYVFSFLDRTILTLLVEPMKADLGLSDSEVSYLLGFSFAVVYAVFGLPLGRLADSKNRTLLIAAGLAFWSLATASCGMAQRYWQLLLARMGVGVGEATLSPAAFSIITDTFPRERLGTAISVYSTGIYLGAGLSTVVGGFVAAYAAKAGALDLPLIGEVRPWQLVFFVIGAGGILPLALLLLTVREPARRGVSGRAKAMPLGQVFGYLKQNRATVFCHHGAFALLSFSGYGVGAWVPTYLVRVHHWPIAKVGLWLGVNAAVTMTVGILAGGVLADWLLGRGIRDAKMKVGLLSAALWIPTGIAYPLAPSGEIAFLLLVPTSFCSALATGLAPAAIQEIMPNPMRGQASAIYLFVANLIGLGLGPTAVAWCTDYLFQNDALVNYSIVLVGGGAHVIASILFLCSFRPYRRSLDRLAEWERAAAVPSDG